MNVVLHAFFSQQNKVTGEFLLNSCAGSKQLAYLGTVLEGLGWNVRAVVPQNTYAHPFTCFAQHVYVPCSNPLQRVHWDTVELRGVYECADVAILQHELLAIPLRALFPKLKIVQFCTVEPEPMFKVAWDAADLVVAQGAHAAYLIKQQTKTPVVDWGLAYDDTKFWRHPIVERPIDVLFVQRCSANNYTHHVEFLEQMAKLTGLNVAFTDPTQYLRTQRPDLNYMQDSYIDTLYKTKVAVSLTDDCIRRISMLEAVRAGCVPVVADALCYDEYISKHWPYRCRLDNVADTVLAALADKPDVTPIQAQVLKYSYQASYPAVLADLKELMK